jgi:hypothetical protein
VVAGKNYRTVSGYVFDADDIDAAKERVGDGTDQPDDHTMEHQYAPLHLGIMALCDFVGQLSNHDGQPITLAIRQYRLSSV